MIASESNGHWKCEEPGKWNWWAKHPKWCNLLNHITTCRLCSVKKEEEEKAPGCAVFMLQWHSLKLFSCCKYLNMWPLKFCWAPCENHIPFLCYWNTLLEIDENLVRKTGPYAVFDKCNCLFAHYPHHFCCDNIDWLKMNWIMCLTMFYSLVHLALTCSLNDCDKISLGFFQDSFK